VEKRRKERPSLHPGRNMGGNSEVERKEGTAKYKKQ
jgi:hypothetical protein